MHLTTLRLSKEAFKFSAGHFTLFSATERENLHGHNFTLAAEFTCEVDSSGLAFDYGLGKTAVKDLCDRLDETFLLPTQSPWLEIDDSSEPGRILACFADERIPFLERDVTLLPVANISVEELARWTATELHRTFADNPDLHIHGLSTEVASGPGQCARFSIQVKAGA
jgi:6-pyruvoyltetrahydropterin/6-carboxytetrahydropterin synthase